LKHWISIGSWDSNAKLTTASIRAGAAKAADEGTPIKALERGDVETRLENATKRVTAEYELPFLAHATMEPINTTVHVRPDGCDIWVGTQTPVVAQKHAARITGLPVDKVALHNHLIGGGFGRRLQADTIEQAVRFAKQVPYPLKIIWTREQDIRHDRFRPCYLDRLAAGLDEHGRPSVWTHRTTSGTVRRYFDEDGWPEGKLDKDAVEGAWDSPYALPAIRVDWIRHDPPVKLNWWRGVGPTHNVFVVESFLDELAHAAGQDPIAYRRALLEANPRSKAVLDKVADAAGWNRPLKPRSGRGVSLHQNFGTYAALVVEVAVALSGEISLTKIVAAVDCGIQINPDTVRAQIEGGVLFGLSAALFNGITFDEGRVTQGNFNDYRQLRINETPPIEVHLLDNREGPGGLGEVGTVSAAPALANAIFAATGIRLRRLPVDRWLLSKRESS
jgi:isoquinoline 1-oxidoreductase beta subunit